MSALFIQPHLGLGDALICQGMVRALAKRHEQVIWPCKARNLKSVSMMLEDLPNVMVWQMPNEGADDFAGQLALDFFCHPLRLGLHSGQRLRTDWDRQMYDQAGVHFNERWVGFRVPERAEMESQSCIPFVHDDPSRGFRIDVRKLPGSFSYPFKTSSIWDHLAWLQAAPEIHVIDSCFLCLADSVPTVATRLVLHAYATAKAKPSGPPTLRKRWEILT